MATLKTRLVDVVGGRTARALSAGLELDTIADLLRHYPRRLAESARAVRPPTTSTSRVLSVATRYSTPSSSG